MANGQPENSQGPSASTGTANSQQETAITVEDVWDEEQLEKAMKTLKEMHIQLRGLRTTIPRLIAPLTTIQASPEVLFREFSKSATTANKEVQEFRRLVLDEESVKVLEHARKSRADNPNGIKPWKVTDHPDWLTKDL